MYAKRGVSVTRGSGLLRGRILPRHGDKQVSSMRFVTHDSLRVPSCGLSGKSSTVPYSA